MNSDNTNGLARRPKLEQLESRLLLNGGLIDNAPPQELALELSASHINESDSVALTASFTDADADDSHFATIDWGDGATEMLFFGVGARDFAHDHQYLDDNPSGTASDAYTVIVTLSDGEDSDTTSVGLTVNNVAPVITDLASSAAGIGTLRRARRLPSQAPLPT